MNKKIYTKQYYENFALNALKKYYPEKFSECVKSECPDWVCNNVGLGITRAITKKAGKLDAFIKEYIDKEFSEIKKEHLQKLGFADKLTKSNFEYLYETRSPKNGILTFLHAKDGRYILAYHTSHTEVIDDCINNIKHAVEEKLQKLNNNYKRLEENDLAIIVQEQLSYNGIENVIIDDISKKILDNLKNIYNNTTYSIIFDTIYIIFYDNIFAVNTKNFCYEHKKISSDAFHSLAIASTK